MSEKKDSLLLKIILLDNILTVQLVLMSPAFAASAKKPWLCAAVFALLFLGCRTGLYLLSAKKRNIFYKTADFLHAPIISAAAALFFMTPRDSLVCGATVLLSELILALINGRIRVSDINPALRIIAECISACILSMAMLGLRF